MQFETNARGGWIVPAYTRLPTWVEVPAWSELGNYCKLGDSCSLGNGCKLGDDCTLGARCTLGDYCKIGDDCTLGNYCRLGDNSKLGDGCKLGHGCELGANTQWMGVVVESWLTLANVDGLGRQIKVVKHALGVRVEAGCFQGTLEDFCTKAAGEGKGRYVRVVSAVAAAM